MKINQKAITLISLIVTIIILLILSTISISMLLGENGIIEQAEEAKQKTINSQNNENSTLLGLQTRIDDTISPTSRSSNGSWNLYDPNNIGYTIKGVNPVDISSLTYSELLVYIDINSAGEKFGVTIPYILLNNTDQTFFSGNYNNYSHSVCAIAKKTSIKIGEAIGASTNYASTSTMYVFYKP